MKKIILLLTMGLISHTYDLWAQQKPSVDPTKVMSRAGYSLMFYDKERGNAQVNSRLAFTLGVNRWRFSIKPDIVSMLNASSPQGFKTGLGDQTHYLKRFLCKSNVALVAMVELGVPTGSLSTRLTFPKAIFILR